MAYSRIKLKHTEFCTRGTDVIHHQSPSLTFSTMSRMDVSCLWRLLHNLYWSRDSDGSVECISTLEILTQLQESLSDLVVPEKQNPL